MYKCTECGLVFKEPKMMMESHGELLGHCPECLSIGFEDVDDLRCEVCEGGIVEYRGDRWCHECKMKTKQIMNDCIISAINHTDSEMGEIVNTFEDVMNGKKIETFKASQMGKWLMIGVMTVAYELNADIREAFDLVEAWAIGTME